MLETPWSLERLEQLRSHVAAGLSYGRIAQLLETSRSAVIGKANRLGFVRAAKPIEHARRKLAKPPVEPAPQVEQVPEPPVEPVEPTPDPRIGSYTLVELDADMCRWPTSDSPGFRFCGDKSVDGLPYCAAHVQTAYVIPPRRSRRSRPPPPPPGAFVSEPPRRASQPPSLLSAPEG
jgi:GcrA cell cycle regulator